MLITFFIPLIFYIISYCKFLRNRRASNMNNENNNTSSRNIQGSNMNNENNNLKKKHYLFQNDLKVQIYNENMIKFCNECTICLEQFIVNKIRICFTPCNHIFHFSCLKEYIIKSNDTHCPNCKFDFFSLLNDKNINYDLVKIDDNYPNDNIDDDQKIDDNCLTLNNKNKNSVIKNNIQNNKIDNCNESDN